jgi:hypothetical protein
MVARGTEELLQPVVGPRPVRYSVAMEQARPVTASDLQEVPQRPLELPGPLDLTAPVPQQGSIAPPNLRAGLLPGIVENRRGPMKQAKGGLDGRP